MEPNEATLFRVNEDRPASEFTHFNLVIRLSIVKQLAFPFSTILRDPAAPVVPINLPISSSVAQERLTKKSKLAFYDRECA
jgi:hypothetical protein